MEQQVSLHSLATILIHSIRLLLAHWLRCVQNIHDNF